MRRYSPTSCTPNDLRSESGTGGNVNTAAASNDNGRQSSQRRKIKKERSMRHGGRRSRQASGLTDGFIYPHPPYGWIPCPPNHPLMYARPPQQLWQHCSPMLLPTVQSPLPLTPIRTTPASRQPVVVGGSVNAGFNGRMKKHSRVRFSPDGSLLVFIKRGAHGSHHSQLSFMKRGKQETRLSPAFIQKLNSHLGPLDKTRVSRHQIVSKCRHKMELLKRRAQDELFFLWSLIFSLLTKNVTQFTNEFGEVRCRFSSNYDLWNTLNCDGEEEGNGPVEHDTHACSRPSTSQLVHIVGASESAEIAVLAGMNNALTRSDWSNALFLSFFSPSSQDQTNVMNRYVDWLRCQEANHSTRAIVTYYELLLRKVPSALTDVSSLCANKYKQHLAMILAVREEIGRALFDHCISILIRSLESEKRVIPVQVCKLLAHGHFEPGAQHLLGHKTSDNDDLTLVDAILLTEIYEYACGSCIEELIEFKIEMASWMREARLYEKCWHYCEIVAKTVLETGTLLRPALLMSVIDTAYMVKGELVQFNQSLKLSPSSNPDWLKALEIFFASRLSTAAVTVKLEKSEIINEEHLAISEHPSIPEPSLNQHVQSGSEHSAIAQPSFISHSLPEQSIDAQSLPISHVPATYPQSLVDLEKNVQELMQQTCDNSESYEQQHRQESTIDEQSTATSLDQESDMERLTNAMSAFAFNSEPSDTSPSHPPCPESNEVFDNAFVPDSSQKEPKENAKKQSSSRVFRIFDLFKRTNTGPPVALLPDDSKKKLVYNEAKKRWIDMDDPNDGDARRVDLPPPSTMISESQNQQNHTVPHRKVGYTVGGGSRLGYVSAWKQMNNTQATERTDKSSPIFTFDRTTPSNTFFVPKP